MLLVHKALAVLQVPVETRVRQVSQVATGRLVQRVLQEYQVQLDLKALPVARVRQAKVY